MSSQWNDSRPMSPHLQVWRWHPAMASSILHRASAIICYIALIIVAIGILVLATTGRLPLQGLVFSPLGAIGLLVFLWGFLFMAFAQIRHAIWGKGAMMEPEKNNKLSYLMIGGSVVLALILTIVAAGAV